MEELQQVAGEISFKYSSDIFSCEFSWFIQGGKIKSLFFSSFNKRFKIGHRVWESGMNHFYLYI